MLKTAIPILILLAPTIVKAEASCKDVLAVAYDVQDISGTFKSFSIAKSHACASNKSASQVNGGIVVEGLPITLGLSQEETSAWCRDNFQSTAIENEFKSKILKVHDLVIQKWASCMDGQATGLRVSLTPMLDPADVALAMQFNPYDSKGTKEIYTPILKNLKCPDLPLVVGQRKYYVCTRDPELDSSITINAVDGISPEPIQLKGKYSQKQITTAFNDVSGWYSLSIDPAHIRVDNIGLSLTYYFHPNVLKISGIGGFIDSTTAMGTETVVRPDGTKCTGIFRLSFSNSKNYTRVVKKYPDIQPSCTPAPLQFDVLTGSTYLAVQGP